MTVRSVLVELVIPSLDGTYAPATMNGEPGEVWATPTRRHNATTPAGLVLPSAQAAKLDSVGQVTLHLEHNDLSWLWRIDERVNRGRTRFLNIEDGPAETVLLYRELPDTDPGDGSPQGAIQPWWDALEDEEEARAAADALRALLTDPRFSDSRPPTGGAGGVLAGTYPSPAFAVDMAEQSELATEITNRIDGDLALDIEIAAEAAARSGADAALAAALEAGYQELDIVGVADGVTDVSATFEAAAAAALADGRTYIRVKSGLYHCPGMTSDDMGGLYIVGDNVRFTNTTYVRAFSAADTLAALRQRATEGQASGRLSIVIDDALNSHWTGIMPVTKELGIPIGTAWPISNGSGPWMKEAYRHGWEILAHGTTHENFTTLTEPEIDAAAQQMVAAVAAATGSTRDIGFVYPVHNRNTTTDRILSKYFAFGRGIATNTSIPTNGRPPWLVKAVFVDSKIDGLGNLNEQLIEIIQAAAHSDNDLPLYMHVAGDAAVPAAITALRQIVALARTYGMKIVAPSRLHGGRRITPDPYQEATVSPWTPSAGFALSAEAAYKGTTSFKFTPGGGFTQGTIVSDVTKVLPAPSRAGHFAVLRASYRHSNAAIVTTSGGTQGLYFQISAGVRNLDGTESYPGVMAVTPMVGNLPIATWARIAQAIILGPDVAGFFLYLKAQNISGGQPAFYVSELKADLIDYVTALKYDANLAGTTGVAIRTGVWDVGRYAITITARAAHAGRLYYTTANDTITVFSTDAADVGAVRVVVSPHVSYSDLAFPTGGA